MDRFFNTVNSQFRVLDRCQTEYRKNEYSCVDNYVIIIQYAMVRIEIEVKKKGGEDSNLTKNALEKEEKMI